MNAEIKTPLTIPDAKQIAANAAAPYASVVAALMAVDVASREQAWADRGGPELLAALKALCAWSDHPSLTGLPDGDPVPEDAPDFDATVKMVHAATAKAEGR